MFGKKKEGEKGREEETQNIFKKKKKDRERHGRKKQKVKGKNRKKR